MHGLILGLFIVFYEGLHDAVLKLHPAMAFLNLCVRQDCHADKLPRLLSIGTLLDQRHEFDDHLGFILLVVELVLWWLCETCDINHGLLVLFVQLRLQDRIFVIGVLICAGLLPHRWANRCTSAESLPGSLLSHVTL